MKKIDLASVMAIMETVALELGAMRIDKQQSAVAMSKAGHQVSARNMGIKDALTFADIWCQEHYLRRFISIKRKTA